MSETISSAATAMRPGIAADMTGFVGIRLACTTALYRRLFSWPARGLDLWPAAQVFGCQAARRAAGAAAVPSETRRC